MPNANQAAQSVLVTNNNFDEELYLAANPDVAQAVLEGRIRSGRVHFDRFGRNEGRRMQLRTDQDLTSSKWRHKSSAVVKQLTPRTLRRWAHILRKKVGYLPGSLRSLEARLKDQEVLLEQLVSIIQREVQIPLPPPKHLQVRVTGGYSPNFIESGFTSIYPCLSRAVQRAGKELTDFSKILDFGCGCGRVIRALSTLLPEAKLFGIDIDDEAILWLQQNYSKFGQFAVAPHLPPTAFQANMFDLVFGISVFTHLPEDMQFLWLAELARITKPGGYVILSTHGEGYYYALDGHTIEILQQKGFYYTDFGFNYGRSISLPDFYQTAFHTPAI
jgi:SAM-dependent methyltransferase